jgi:predicted MFS family arabinose efflux permease
MPTTVAASLLAMIGIFNVAGTIASGWFTDRVDARRLLAAYYALRGTLLVFVPLLMASTVRPSMVFFVVCFGLLDVATVPPTIALCREFYREDGAVVFGWVGAAHQLGAGVVAVLGGAARDAFGSYDLVWIAAAVLCGMAAVLALAIRNSEGAAVPVFTRAGGVRLNEGLECRS